MIPKKIHYCWFGRNKLPELAQKCIASWEKYCPEYEIVQWNEDNYDISKYSYSKEAYAARKWAFVSDIARLEIVYNEGGLYLDTDVELIQSLDAFLDEHAFLACEDEHRINPGLGFGAEKRNPVIKMILDSYSNRVFTHDDGTNDYSTIVEATTNILMVNSIIGTKEVMKYENVTIYPKYYFSPKDLSTNKISLSRETVSIHHLDGSWLTKRQRLKRTVVRFFIKRFGEGSVQLLLDLKKIFRRKL